jgi:hypothetical protein
MESYLSFDKIFKETKFQLGGGVNQGLGELVTPYPIGNYAPHLRQRMLHKEQTALHKVTK